MKKLLKYLWQLPQHLIALVLLAIYKLREHQDIRHFGDVTFIIDGDAKPGYHTAFTLGEYIFTNTTHQGTLRHEYGHTLQSRILGPLYLLVIALPSLINETVQNDDAETRFYTEAWAVKLGGTTNITLS
jgi:hypothetical protein